jgi:CRP/FNR family transcriptional regulator, cyclic AMP receptor protein
MSFLTSVRENRTILTTPLRNSLPGSGGLPDCHAQNCKRYIVRKPAARFRDAIFIVVEERSCPIYNVGEEFKVEKFCLSVPSHKPDCLCLAQEIAKIVASKESFVGFSKFSSEKPRFDCGGCEGLIHFEFKKEKDFKTLQMKLLGETEERYQRRHLEKFFGVLRDLDIFEPLDDDALSNLTLLLDMKNIPTDKVVIRAGDPGSNLYIVLKGGVAVKADDGSRIAEMGAGEIFGEMSLLTGEPATSSIYTTAPTQVAMLSSKNFKHVLKKYPVLQLFLFKMLVDRAQTLTLRAGMITSGMKGKLAELSAADLFHRLYTLRKTGTIRLVLKQGQAVVVFQEGRIIHARFLDFRNKEAVSALLGMKEGHFTYTKGIPDALDGKPPLGGFSWERG